MLQDNRHFIMKNVRRYLPCDGPPHVRAVH
jgi:hypothetical protein